MSDVPAYLHAYTDDYTHAHPHRDTDALPHTASNKVMRRVLRDQVVGD